MIKYIINAFRGFCMALADSVPGVSGGTVAFVLGFYDKFITSLDDLFRGTWKEKKKALVFLFKIGIGWIIGMALSALVLTSLFEKHIYGMSSLFLGFVILSIPFIVYEERKSLKKNYFNIIWLILGIALVVGITLLNGTDILTINVSNPNFLTYVYIFLSASVAITAMVLPGISGSTILLICGLYLPIMNAIKTILHFDFSPFFILLAFGLGVLFGIIAFARIIRKGLEKHRGAIVYAILGMMIGSLYAICMGPTTLEVPKDMLSFSTFNILLFILGGLIILGLEEIKKYLHKKKVEE